MGAIEDIVLRGIVEALPNFAGLYQMTSVLKQPSLF